jgi:DNA-binding CsgD family transcriptional regulator
VELHSLGTAAGLLGGCDIAAKFANAAIVELRRRGHVALLAQALLVRAWNETILGNLNVALPAAEEARRLGEESGQPIFQAGAQVAQAIQAALRGDSKTADSLASTVEAVAVATGTTALRAVVQFARGLASLADGHYEEAYDRLFRVFDAKDPAYHYFTRYWVIGDIVEAAVHCGRHEGARRLLADMESVGRVAPLPFLHLGLAYARPLLAQEGDAEPLFVSALAQDLKNWPFYRGRLLLAYGSWLRRQRRLAESRTPLRVARDTFDALGVVPWGERARQELNAAGETSRKRRAGAWNQLTPQELQIAQMAAEGMSNREIGEHLYLSHRTVSSHLYHVFPKLGVTSRAQLHQALSTTPA